MLNYGHHVIDEDDIAAVVEVLRSDYITTGPQVELFEEAFAEYVGAKYAVAVNSGTAALHCAMYAAGVESRRSVVLPPLTFVATANVVRYMGATHRFADVDSTGLMDVGEVWHGVMDESVSAVITVDYAGQRSHYGLLRGLCKALDIPLIADACHSLGAKGVGSLADITCFSFHPVKAITTGEGGMLTTDSEEYAERARLFRNHGRDNQGNMKALGHNYRLTDIACALGRSQLRKLDGWIDRRNCIARGYDAMFYELKTAKPLRLCPQEDREDAYHLYILRSPQRSLFMEALGKRGIGTTVHYLCVYEHSYYRRLSFFRCFTADVISKEVFSIPLYPSMTDDEVIKVAYAVVQVDEEIQRGLTC